MESLIREKQRLKKTVEDKDTEIEDLKREIQQYKSKVEELEAKDVSLQMIVLPAHSSSLEKDKPPTSHLANLPARPPAPEKKPQPISILANLPARSNFTGFETTGGNTAPKASLFAPTAFSPKNPPWSAPLYAGLEPVPESNIPPTLPTRLGRRPKGRVPPLLPHHQSFGASHMPSPALASPALSQDLDTPNLSPATAGTSASTKFPAARSNKYFHGQVFGNIPVPQGALLPHMSSSPPSSFDFNRQSGNTWEKRRPSTPFSPFDFRPSLAGTQLCLSQSDAGLARYPCSSANSPLGAVPQRSARSIDHTIGPTPPYGNRLGAMSASLYRNVLPPSSSSTDASVPPSFARGLTQPKNISIRATLGTFSSLAAHAGQTVPSIGAGNRSSAAKPPSSSPGLTFSNQAYQQHHASESSTGPGLVFKPFYGTTKASSTHQGSIIQGVDLLPASPLLPKVKQQSAQIQLQMDMNETSNDAGSATDNEEEEEEVTGQWRSSLMETYIGVDYGV